MPIQIQYQPRAAEVFNLAYQGGIGEFQKWLAEQQLRRDAMDQQAAENQQRLAVGVATQQQNRLFDAQRLQYQTLANQQRDERNDASAMALAKQQHQWGLDRGQQVHELGLERDKVGAGLEWEAQSAEQVEQQTDQLWNNYFNNRQQIADEDQATFREFAADLQAIKKARSGYRPQQYAQALGEFSEKLERSGIRARMKTPKTFEEEVDEASLAKPVLAPDGTFMGWNVWTKQVRNGQSVPTSRFVPFKPEKPDKETEFSVPTAAGFATWLKENRKNFSTQDAEGNVKPASIDELAKRYQEEVAAARKIEEEMLAKAQKSPATRPVGNPGQQPPPSPAGMPPAGMPAAPPAMPPQPPQGMPPPGFDPELPPPPPAALPPMQPPAQPPVQPPAPTVPANVAGAPGVDPAAMDPEVRRRLTPERIAAVAAMGAANPVATAALLAGIEIAREREDAAQTARGTPGGKPAKARVDDIPPQDQELLNTLPRPRSKNDFDKLPKGTEYIAPDGSLRRK